jgi:hypothetical protein
MPASRSGRLPASPPQSAHAEAGRNIQVLLRSYAKFLAEARNHANRLIEESMQRWEAPTDDPEGALAGPWPGSTLNCRSELGCGWEIWKVRAHFY